MNAIIIGNGKMGKLIDSIWQEKGHSTIAMYNRLNLPHLKLLEHPVDVVFDFSSPSALPYIEAYVKESGCPLVSGTTGFTADNLKTFTELSSYAPVLYSPNFSLGIAIFKAILKDYSKVLIENDFQVELVEAHHKDKKDAPSGTAKGLLDSIDPDGVMSRIYGRSESSAPRTPTEIGVHSLRGGTVPGEHTLYFFGEDENLTLRHTAMSRKIFAAGAVTAALKLVEKDKGNYTFEEIMEANR